MSSRRMVTVREGTRMPQSLKNMWRWLAGASAAAMLIAIVSPAANAQVPDTGIISICVAKDGQIAGINTNCRRRHQIKLTWNIPGPEGAQGLQGPVGPSGVQGEPGPTGSQGAVGAVGPAGPMGAMGLTGPVGVQGVTGPSGPTGNVGKPGPTGVVGVTGPSGTPAAHTGDDVEILSGGSLGATIGHNADIQLTTNTGTSLTGGPTFPLYMGPGNGAAGNGNTPSQTTVQVPTPGGTAFNLLVSITPPGIGAGGRRIQICRVQRRQLRSERAVMRDREHRPRPQFHDLHHPDRRVPGLCAGRYLVDSGFQKYRHCEQHS